MKRTMYIRRKGFNYYTDYTEKYLHDALSNYGYYLVREKDKSVFLVVVSIPEQEKYMSVQSSFLDMLSEDEIAAAGEIFSESFKSEVIIAPTFENSPLLPWYVFYFSDTHNAFELPAFVTKGSPEPVQETRDLTPITPGKTRVYDFVNYGGPGVGLDICIYGADEDCFEEFSVNRWIKNRRITVNAAFVKEDDHLFASLPNFVIPAGINKNSAALRGRKLATEKSQRGLFIRLIPSQNFHQEHVRILLRPHGSEKEYPVNL